MFTVVAPRAGSFPCKIKIAGSGNPTVAGVHIAAVNGREHRRAPGAAAATEQLELRAGVNTVTVLGRAGGPGALEGLAVAGVASPAAAPRTPFITMEAEAAVCTGALVPVSHDSYNTTTPHLGSEASNRSGCFIGQGQAVSFAANAWFNAVSVRYSIPDAPAGGGLVLVAELLLNGSLARRFELTSAYSWYYGR